MVNKITPTRRWDKAVEALRKATVTYTAATAEVEQARGEMLKELTGCTTIVTSRQREVLTLVKAGKLNKEIADMLSIEERTVKFHLTNLLKKFNVTTRYQL